MDSKPPGYRFFPTEEELVSFYLHHRLEGDNLELHRVIPVVEVSDVEPWDLPKAAGEMCRGDLEQWFFFAARQAKEAMGGRPKRSTAMGYWKATGSPGHVYSSDNKVIGIKKSMVFYKGRCPTGRKTQWKMKEYKAIEEEITSSGEVVLKVRNEFSVCRVYVASPSVKTFDRRPPRTKTVEIKRENCYEHAASINQSTTRTIQEESLLDIADFYETYPEMLEWNSWEPSLGPLDHQN